LTRKKGIAWMQKTWVSDLGVFIVLWQYIRQKVFLLKPFDPKLPLPFAQICVQYDYVVNAILGDGCPIYSMLIIVKAWISWQTWFTG
jgi:hypothetical protein